MAEEPVSAEERGTLSSASLHELLVDAGLGLLLPGLVLIFTPGVLLAGDHPVATAVVLILEMFLLSVHLGLQGGPDYRRVAPLLFVPLAAAPLFAFWLSVEVSLLVGILALLPAVVFGRAAWMAWKQIR